MSVLGITALGEPLALSLEALIGSHLCVAANSGGGKSGAIRRLLEATHGQVQHIVLDAEDEFYTLRERYDYVIAGGDGGDSPATTAGARGLARAALSHGFSLIAQLNDLGDDAAVFIAEFLDALITAPRDQWRPLLVVIDEAQRFAPTSAQSEASKAIKDLLQRGRKRGFTAVLATTRISELNPGVRGLVRNWMLGLVGQSLDRRTAADQLGFGPTSAEARGLQLLEPRQFWAFGPALSRLPVLFTVGDVETTIVKSGQAKVPTPPPPEALREILAGLAVSEPVNSAQESDAAREAAVARGAEVRELRAELVDANQKNDELHGVIAAYQRAFQAQCTLIGDISWPSIQRADGSMPSDPLVVPSVVPSAVVEQVRAPQKTAIAVTEVVFGTSSDAPSTKGSRAMVEALARHYPRALPIEHIAKIAGVSMKSSQWRANRTAFEESPLTKPFSVLGYWEMSTEGRDAFGLAGKPDDPAALLAFWRDAFVPSTGNMLQVLVHARGQWLERDEIARRAGVSLTSSSLGSGLKELRDHGLAEQQSGAHRAAKVLL